MDPLTAAVLAAITSFVTTKTEDFLNKAGEVALAKARAIFGKLKERWQGDEAASRDLDSFAREPGVYAPVIQARLEQRLAEDGELRAELERLVSDMGPHIEVVQRMARGEGVTGVRADEVSRGRVSVQQQVDEGKDVTGASFGKIG